MDDAAIAEFLEDGGTGVISFAAGADEPPYAIPLSYGYDRLEGELFLRLAVGSGGAKESHLDSPFSFVVHDSEDGLWASVVVTGRLESVGDEEVDAEVLDSLRRTEIPLVDVFDREARKVEFRFFRAVVDKMSGRREVPSEA
jgi:hypothetical protein